ncbi:MAG: response regulator [Elusimicrobia bacterium]|nr:response regulator [Elusimicrobiota bacterium]
MPAKTIFVIDDDESIRALLEVFLSTLGYKVCLAKTAIEADGLLAKNSRPDLILLDIMMPQLNGLEFAKKLNAQGSPAIPIIIMTALKDEETARDALEAGCVDFISKPFRTEDLKRRIERALTP